MQDCLFHFHSIWKPKKLISPRNIFCCCRSHTKIITYSLCFAVSTRYVLYLLPVCKYVFSSSYLQKSRVYESGVDSHLYPWTMYFACWQEYMKKASAYSFFASCWDQSLLFIRIQYIHMFCTLVFKNLNGFLESFLFSILSFFGAIHT